MLINLNIFEKIKFNLIYGYILFLSFYAPVTSYFPALRFLFSGLALLFVLFSLVLIKNKLKLIFSFIFIIYLIISVMNFGILKSLYGFYIYSFFLFSFTIKKYYIVKFLKSNYFFWLIIFLINIFAVLYVDKNGSPWIGNSIENFGMERRLSKEWTAGSMIRNPGFSNSSVSVACLILLSYLMSYITLNNNYRKISCLFLIALYPLVMYVIFLTTTKTILVALLISTVFLILPVFCVQLLSKSTILIMTILSYFFFFSGGKEYYGNNTLLIRFYDMWPSAFEILDSSISIFFGKGFSSIGTAQNFYNPYHLSNPGDNLLVYLYVCFGFFSVLACLYFLINFLNNNIKIPNVNAKHFYIIFMVIIFNSFTYNMVELSVLAIIFGIFLKNSMYSYAMVNK